MQLAALGPATGLCDTFAYWFNFLSIVTTAHVARAVTVRKDEADAARGVGDGVVVAAALGACSSAVLLSPLGSIILAAFCGAGGGASAAYFPAALAYTRIRALGLVPSLTTTVYQSACLARHDTSKPLLAVALASVFNLAGDVILVRGAGMGAAGAAWATVAAQVVACLALWRNENKHTLAAVPAAVPAAAPVGRARSVADRVAGSAAFVKQCMSPATALAGKCLVVMMLSATASAAGAIGLAAHQVTQSVNCLFTPFGEALSMTAQSVLPGQNAAAAAVNSKKLTPSARRLAKSLLVTAVGLGAVNACAAGVIPLLASAAFTTDAAVAGLLAALAPWMMGCLLLHALSTTLEGLLFTTGDGDFLGRLYPINSAVMVSVFIALRRRGAPLHALWSAMAAYNAVRIGQFGLRLALNQREAIPPPPPPQDGGQGTICAA